MGAVVAAELHLADDGHTTTLSKSLAAAEANLEEVDTGTEGGGLGRLRHRQRVSFKGSL